MPWKTKMNKRMQSFVKFSRGTPWDRIPVDVILKEMLSGETSKGVKEREGKGMKSSKDVTSGKVPQEAATACLESMSSSELIPHSEQGSWSFTLLRKSVIDKALPQGAVRSQGLQALCATHKPAPVT